MTSKHKSPILICGSGRSGTTWVQDVLAESNQYGTVFEPLHPDVVRGARGLANRYVRPGDHHPELREFLTIVFEGRLRSVWANLRARPDRLFPTARELCSRKGAGRTKATYLSAFRRWKHGRQYEGRPKIVKFIRANLMIEWIRNEFGLRTAFIVRHPCAVLSSVSQRSGEEWGCKAMGQLLARYLEQPALVEARLQEKLSVLQSLKSMAGIHTAIWCIENAELVAKNRNSEMQIACYEDLVTGKNSAWQRLAEGLQLEGVPDAELLARPSQQARYGMNEKSSGDEQLSSWQKYLKKDQQAEVQEILNLFEVDLYSADEPLPQRQLLVGEI